MENASKALIMAGSVLIALMIIGALLLMFTNLSNYQQTRVEGEVDSQVVEFNNQFSTYNRPDVRGSELYSLLNRAIDYNRTQSTAGTSWADQGQNLAYEPVTIHFTMDISDLSADGTNRLFTKGNYTISGNTNEFANDIIGMISALESNYGTDALTNLTTNLTKIFPTNPSESQKNDAVATFKSACKRKTITTVKNNTSSGSSYTVDNIAWENLKDDTNGSIRRNIYTYYEYVQFKRAHFKCDDVTYNQETGRITRMDFSFTGEFN